MIVADTSVVSEFMRERADAAVAAWAAGITAGELTITVITVEEVERGIASLSAGRRRRDLEQRWRKLVDIYSQSVLPYDLAAARATAQILVGRARAGSPMGLADAQIAGICVSRSCVLATRNVRDFAGTRELDLVNPFDLGKSGQ